MNRFSRLEGLRRLKEEAAGQAFAGTLVQIDTLRQRIVALEQESADEKAAAIAAWSGSERPDSNLLERFLTGQAWRRKRLDEALLKAQKESEQARVFWLSTRVQLQQAELLAKKEALRIQQEQRRKEAKEMDLIGIYRAGHNLAGQHQVKRGAS